MQESLPTEPSRSPNTASNRPRQGLSIFLATLAIILTLCSLLLQYFFWQLLRTTEEKISSQGQQLQSALQPQLQQLTQEINQQKQELKEDKQTLNNLLAKSQSEDRKKALMLAEEAEHLLTLAQYNLLFENNIASSSKLISAAEQKLQEMNDPGIASLRRILTEHLAALNTVQQIDVISVISQISAISNQVATLSNLPAVTSVAPGTKAESSSLPSWKEKLMNTLHSLRGIVTIRRLPEDIKPLASSEQQLYYIENIRLKLMQAEWALLHQNPVLYQSSLQQVKAQLEKYYAQNSNGAKLITQINELLKINVKPVLPDLSNAMTLLHLYISNLLTQSQTLNQPSSAVVDQSGQLPQTIPAPTNGSLNLPSKPSIPKTDTILPRAATKPIPRALPS